MTVEEEQLTKEHDEFVHLRQIEQKPKNPNAFINPFKAFIYFIMGNRGSGKSSLDEVIAEENFKAGHTILDLHSAGNYESLYWVITKKCKEYWDRWRIENEKKPEKEREIEALHCNCTKRYKTLLVIPDYVEIEQEALDGEKLNHKYYSKREWAELGHIEYGTLVTKANGEKIREKPLRPDYIEWLKVRKIHVPNKGYKNRELFVNDLTEIMLIGKNERRIITFNPVFFKEINHKLLILEKTLREIPEIIRSNFKTNTPRSVAKQRGLDKPVPFGQWTVQEKNSHRVTLIIREFGSLVASMLTEERNQVIVKKAVFALVKVCRHFHVSLVGDMQRGGDVLKNVRDQRDYFIWKQSNIDIVPEDYEWLKTMIKEFKDKVVEKVGIGYAQKLYPNMEDLAPDQMYVLYPKKNEKGNIFKLFSVRMPEFHHHSADDDFEDDTGLIKETDKNKDIATWRFVIKDKEGTLIDSAKDDQVDNKKDKEEKMTKIFEVTFNLMNPEDPSKKMKQQDIFDHIGQLKMRPETWTYPSFRKWYSREKKKRGIK